MRRGSFTIFAAISFMLIAGLLFTLAEGTRYTQLCRVADGNTKAVGQALPAEYCIPLWQQYQILGYSPAYGEEAFSLEEMEKEATALTDMNFAVEERFGLLSQYNLLRLSVAEAGLSDYKLLTDGRGSAFMQAVTAYMEGNLLYEESRFALSESKEIYNLYQSVKSITDKGSFSLGDIGKALDAIKEEANRQDEAGGSGSSGDGGSSGDSSSSGGEAGSGSGGGTGTGSAGGGETYPDILTLAKECMAKGILVQVLPSGAGELSSAGITLSSTVSHRRLQKGKGGGEVGLKDRFFLLQYLMTRFICYTDGLQSKKGDKAAAGKDSPQNHVLSYELEYMIGQKASDLENLKKVAEELLAIREACNLAYLAASTEKREALRALAATVSAAAANPLVGEAVTAGLMMAWAYGESLMDVRALLAGKKVPAIKSDATWTCTLENLPKVFSSSMQAKESPNGIGYKAYLGILLFMKGGESCGFHALDLMELALRKEENYKGLRMDYMVTAATLTMTYHYAPLFLDFVQGFRESIPSVIKKQAEIDLTKGGG